MRTNRAPYACLANLYDSEWRAAARRLYQAVYRPRLRKTRLRVNSRPLQILDLCAGSGHMTEMLCLDGYAVTGADRSSAMLALAKIRVPTVRFVRCNAA